MLLYIVQIFSFFACIMSALSKDKKAILVWVCIANISNFAVMLIAREMDGWANSLAVVIRGLLVLLKDKVKTDKLLYLCVIIHILAFIVSYQDLWSCLLIVGTLLVCISQWYGNSKQIKVCALISVTAWCIYTIHIGLYLDIPKRIAEATFLIISLFSILKQEKTKLDKTYC